MVNRSRDPDETMGYPSHFDLNTAIQRWRTELQASPALGPQDLEELEAHLHELVSELKARGHGDEAAFLAAVDRLGGRRELEGEFAKVNRSRIWMTRACWMLLGFVLLHFLFRLAWMFESAVLHNAWGLGVHWMSFLSLIAKYAMQVILVVGVGWFLVRRAGFVSKAVHLCVRRPMLPVMGIVAGTYLLSPMDRWVRDVTAPAGFGAFSPEQIFSLDSWQCWSYYGETAIWVVVLLWMASRLSAVKPAAVEGPSSSATTDWIQDGSRAIQCRVWLERGFWMIIGLQLGIFLWHMMSVWSRALFSLGMGWKMNAHVLPFLVIAAQWIFASVLAWLAATRLVRCGTSTARTAWLGARRPVIAVAGFILVTFVSPHLLGLLPDSWFLGSLQGPYSRSFRWSEDSISLFWNVLPTVLLFWMARRLLHWRVAGESGWSQGRGVLRQSLRP